jgi:hypothetical protein
MELTWVINEKYPKFKQVYPENSLQIMITQATLQNELNRSESSDEPIEFV